MKKKKQIVFSQLKGNRTQGVLHGTFAFILLILIIFPCFSQSSPDTSTKWINPDHVKTNYMGLSDGWFAGADFGPTLFYGDVALYYTFPKLKDYDQSFGSGYSFYGGKRFIYGLSAEVQLFKGRLRGQKRADKLYPRYFRGDVMNYSVSVKYNLSERVFRDFLPIKLPNRLTVFATVGAGQTFFRTRLYKFAVNNQWYLEKADGYSTTGIDSAGIGLGGGLLQSKKALINSVILPVGAKLNYKLNSKTDVVLDLYYVTVFSDKIDAWERSWSHKDKYFYSGIGLMYNFGRSSSDDVPENARFLKQKNNSASADMDIIPSGKIKRGGLFRRKSNDKDLDVKMKLYELQLKLFEMQYLLQPK